VEISSKVAIRSNQNYPTPVYAWNFDSKKRVVVNQGGTSSSKTWSILQVLLTYLKHNKDPILISVVSETLPHLKRGAMRDFFNMLIRLGLYSEKYHNKSNNSFSFDGERIIEFFSADNPSKIRGARRDVLFINECNNIPWEVYDQLEIRTKYRIFLDYNPTCEFWAHERLVGKPYVDFFKSSYRDNPYLDPNIRKSIESRRFIDPNWWRVYGEGEIGRQEGLVFTNWGQVPSFPEGIDSVWYGMDFGFTNDPSSLVKVCVQNGEVCVQEMFYEQGMTNRDISNRLERLGLRKGEDQIIADSAEPKSIYEIRQNGWLIKPVSKGSDSVRGGIQLVQQYHLNVTQDSLNLIKELRNYKWEQDKMTSKFLNTPIDSFNHAIDALRYACMAKLGRRSFVMEQEN